MCLLVISVQLIMMLAGALCAKNGFMRMRLLSPWKRPRLLFISVLDSVFFKLSTPHLPSPPPPPLLLLLHLPSPPSLYPPLLPLMLTIFKLTLLLAKCSRCTARQIFYTGTTFWTIISKRILNISPNADELLYMPFSFSTVANINQDPLIFWYFCWDMGGGAVLNFDQMSRKGDFQVLLYWRTGFTARNRDCYLHVSYRDLSCALNIHIFFAVVDISVSVQSTLQCRSLGVVYSHHLFPCMAPMLEGTESRDKNLARFQ